MPQAPAKQFQVEIKAVFNRWWEESDMDAEDLAKAALSAIDDWLDEEIVGFEPEWGLITKKYRYSEEPLPALLFAMR